MIPKTEKLLVEESVVSYNLDGPTAYMQPVPNKHDSMLRKIKRLFPLNDFVAVWQEPADTSIILSETARYKNEGVVVGVGPKTQQVELGDVVTFIDRAIAVLEPESGFYKNERIIVLGDHSLIMKLRTIGVELVSE
jgi:hypothetical protein